MSITAYKIEAVGHDRTGEDYGYVNIMYRYGNKQPCPRPDQCEKMEVMCAGNGSFINWKSSGYIPYYNLQEEFDAFN